MKWSACAIGTIIFLLTTTVNADDLLNISVNINGDDASTKIPKAYTGESASVRIVLETPEEGVRINDISFASYPGAVGIVLNNAVRKSIEFPYTTGPDTIKNDVYLPWYLPEGLYEITINTHYTHDYSRGRNTYRMRIMVMSGGWTSRILGWIAWFLPDLVTKKIIEVLLLIFG
ncbi:MAG: hypothetical protein ABIH11_06380 [Candidatus Altiarchaeota archaeon]